MRGRRLAVAVVAVAVAVVGVLGAVLAVRASGGSRTGGGEGAGAEVCDILRPRGLLPSQWFDAEGRLVLTEGEAGRLSLTLGVWAGWDGGSGPEQMVSDLLASPPDTPVRLDDEQRGALAELEPTVAEECPN